MSRSLLIVLTPVRNEAWILHAFLKATSLWADYIIIADQMSTDGSRDIYPQYEKVIVIDNPRAEMHQARTRQLLFEAAKKIEGDKILFALDADEFLSGDFISTKSWKTILESKSGDVFYFAWNNILPNAKQYTKSQPFYWVGHLNEEDLDGIYPDNHIHEWRLPWPKNATKYIIDDIFFIHLSQINVERNINKSIFYQVSTAYNDSNYSGVKLFRQYHVHQDISKLELFEITNDMFQFYLSNNLNIFDEIIIQDIGQHYIDETKMYFTRKKTNYFAKLNIWDEATMHKYSLKSPQNIIHKIILLYLKKTAKKCNTIIIRVIDYVLKKIY